MISISININQLSFKQFLEKIMQESGFSKDELYKHKIVLQIPDLETYNLVKNNPRISYSQPIEIKTNEDLQKSRVMLPIFDSNVFYVIRKNANLTFNLEKRNEEELEDQNYRLTFDKIEENLVKIDAELNEFYAKTEVSQYYINHLNNPVELILKFPYDSSVQFSKFTLDINGKKINSKVIEKEKAKEKYSDALASGNTGAISSQKYNYIVVNIGNIGPKSIVKLTTEFIQFLKREDMSYCYSTITKFPIIFSKNEKKTKNKKDTKSKKDTKNKNNKNEDDEVKLKNIDAKITIKAHSKILRLISKGLIQKKTQKFNEDYTQCVLEYISSEVDMKYQASKKSKRKDSDEEIKEQDDECFKILFRTEKMNNFNLITQYDPKKDETSCIMSMIYNRKDINMPKDDKPDINEENNYIDLYQKNLINSYPSLFIFLIDQSGSMDGKPIKLVIETLLFFLQSLPKNSFYQLIGFGSSINYIYSKEPVEYTVDNVNKTIVEIKKLEANLGGTQLYEPLKNIFNNKNYDKLNLCRNLFILTDGEVWDRKKSLNLLKENLDIFRVHSFGIGNEFDRNFIKESGKNGSYCFIKDISKIKSNVIQTLNKTLRNYLFGCKINVKNINTEYSYFTKQKIFYQDEFLNFYFIIKNKINNNIDIDIQYYDKNELIKKNYIFDNNNIICENDGDIISKIIIGNILNNTILDTEKNIELSRKYQVLSKYTSLYAEIENEFRNKNEMSKIEQSEVKNIKNYRENESYSDSDNDSDSDSDSIKKYKKCKKKTKKKYKKCMKKVKISSESESEDKDESESESEEENKKCKKIAKEKCKKKAKISSESESESESENEEKDKKCKRKAKAKKCKKKAKISSESESKSEEEDKKCKKKAKDKKCKKKDESKCESEEDDKIKIGKNIDIKEMALSQNIIEGNWSLNSQTKLLIDSHIDLYNKIKQYVERFNVGEKKEDIIITILIIYFLKNNKEIDQSEYTIIINKGLEYLQTIGIEELLYQNIESRLK